MVFRQVAAISGGSSNRRPGPRRELFILASVVGFCCLFLAVAPVRSAPPAPEGARGRTLELFGGKFPLDLRAVPLLGSPDAPHVVVCLLDHTCYGCRVLHGQLTAARNEFSNQVAIVTLPAPLDGACNPAVKEPFPEHTNGCDYARISLAVWQANRDVFPMFDGWLFSGSVPPPIEETRQIAARLVGQTNLENALKNPSVLEQLKQDTAIYQAAYSKLGAHTMPLLFIGTNMVSGAMPSLADLNRAIANGFDLKKAP